MQDFQVKTIALTYKQLTMIYTMARSAEIRTRKMDSKHANLLSKIKFCQRQAWPSYSTFIYLSPEECKLIRTYNTDYCYVLADNDDEGEIRSQEVKEIYQQATEIQMLFTLRY